MIYSPKIVMQLYLKGTVQQVRQPAKYIQLYLPGKMKPWLVGYLGLMSVYINVSVYHSKDD